jgi:WD40 repeat protein
MIFENTGEYRGELQYVNNVSQTIRSIHSMVSFTKGFVVGCSGGAAAVYEKVDETLQTGAQALAAQGSSAQKEMFKKTREFNLQDSAAKIISMALSPSEDTVLCSTDNCQLYSISIQGSDIKGSDDSKFEVFSQSFHHGIITGMDVCIRKPLIATCASDHSIRVWNYLDSTSELIKYFAEEAFSIALHPSGLYLLVGFSDKLRLMNLLIDDIRTYREFTIRGCRECKFSNGGQYFAAVHGNSIQIFSTWSFENLCHLKGHNGKVRSIYWTSDDQKLITAGMDGAVYEWNLKNLGSSGSNAGKRESESILKTCSYSCAISTPDGKSILAVGSDKTLKVRFLEFGFIFVTNFDFRKSLTLKLSEKSIPMLFFHRFSFHIQEK